MNNYNYMYYTGMFDRDSNDNLFTPEEGYLRGNMDSRLYSEYKDYQPIKVRLNSEKDKMLYSLLTIYFAMHELNLYLDLHSDDVSMIRLFNDYNTKYRSMLNEYESKYGPINVADSSSDSQFNWVKGWPWEVKNV